LAELQPFHKAHREKTKFASQRAKLEYPLGLQSSTNSKKDFPKRIFCGQTLSAFQLRP
jgi:hypothetical protein